MTSSLLLVLLILTIAGYYLGRSGSVRSASGQAAALHSLPEHYGYYVALWVGLPALAIVLLWQIFEPQIIRSIILSDLPADVLALPAERLQLFYRDVIALATGGTPSRVTPDHERAADTYNRLTAIGNVSLVALSLGAAVMCLSRARRRLRPGLRARNYVESTLKYALLICSIIAILTTLGIVLSLLFESFRFFSRVPVTEFLFGLQWSPQTALRAEQFGQSGSFGAIPLITGTLLISAIAMFVAVPIGLMSAIYLSEYAGPRFRAVTKPLLEILAGVPTVVYGFFALLTVAPFVRNTAASLGFEIPAQSAIAAGSVMGVMLIPFISSLSDDVINAVPQSLRDGSYAVGATHSETIRRVLLPAALPGIVGAILLAASRAIGETMIVVMAAGRAANLTANPFEAVTTITVQIVALLTGDQEFDSAKTLSAFALGLFLFFITLTLNVMALRVVQKYREKYD